MDCRLPWADAKTGKVVHVVGHGTDDVFGFLGPATAALARLSVYAGFDVLMFTHADGGIWRTGGETPSVFWADGVFH